MTVCDCLTTGIHSKELKWEQQEENQWWQDLPAMNGICDDVAWIIFCLYGIYSPGKRRAGGVATMCCHDGRHCLCATLPFVAPAPASLALHKCFAF